MTDLVRWLDDRRPAPPASLRLAMIEALEGGDPRVGPVADRLAGAGLDALAGVVTAPPTRPHALRLLAADALITYACEAAVEEESQEGNNAIGRVTGMLDMRRFADILDRTADR